MRLAAASAERFRPGRLTYGRWLWHLARAATASPQTRHSAAFGQLLPRFPARIQRGSTCLHRAAETEGQATRLIPPQSWRQHPLQLREFRDAHAEPSARGRYHAVALPASVAELQNPRLRRQPLPSASRDGTVLSQSAVSFVSLAACFENHPIVLYWLTYA